MSAMIVDIADAVADRLNVPSAFSQTFTAERVYDVAYSLEELATLRVPVLPKAWSGVPQSRKHQENEHQVQVGVMKRVEPTAAGCDPLMLLCEEIIDSFLGDPQIPSLEVRCVSAALEPLYAANWLREKRAFLSVVTLTFREWRGRAA